MRSSACFAIVMALMLLLHHPVAALNWQGTGNLNNDNLTLIWSYIQSNLKTYSTSLATFNVGLSDTLNTAWNPAWNVVTVEFWQINLNYNDAVLYGYAFRNHWMWFNGYKDPNVNGFQYSFVIWKDYNCQTWLDLGQGADDAFSSSGLSSAQKGVINDLIGGISSTQLLNDPWNVAKSLLEGVQASSQFVVADNSAYSIVLQQHFSLVFTYARVCVVGKNYYYSRNDYSNQKLVQADGKSYGQFILFQTR